MRNRIVGSLGVGSLLVAGTVWLQQPAFPEAALPSRPAARGVVDAGPAPLSSFAEPEPVGDASTARAATPLPRPVPSPRLGTTRNVLLVGTDRRPGARYGGLTDTLVVLLVADGAAAVVNVPRDLYVSIPGYPPDRINSVMPRAYMDGVDGRELLSRVLQDTLGISIGHTIVIDIGLFERAIDAVGGVEVGVACPIRDRFLDERTEDGYRWLDLPAGTQTLDGTTAAMFVRSRHGRSDFSRSRRQQAVLWGLRERLTSPSGLLALPTLWAELGQSVRTDMTRAELLGLATTLGSIGPANLHGLVLDMRHLEHHRTEDGKAVLLPKPDAVAAALSMVFDGPAPGARPTNRPCPSADVAFTVNTQRRTTATGAPASETSLPPQ